MKIQIKHRFNETVLFETDAESLGATVLAAIAAKANLSRANLSGAYLSGADLSRANLSGADLSRANLSRANLSRANLSGANLSGADLSRAYLSGAYLSNEQIDALLNARTVLPEGDLIGWKKLSGGTICKLSIPATAKRVGGLIGRKCRAEFVIVLEGEGTSSYDCKIKYEVGETVKPDKFDPNPLVECAPGIHFFITRAEAESY